MRFKPNALMAAVGFCLLSAGLLSASIAQAATVPVSWTNPTANTDGSALAASSITQTTVVWGTSATTLTTGSKVVPGAATSTTIELPPGTWFVGGRTTANGNQSALSNVVQKVVVQPTPNPPVMTVQPVVAGINMSPAYKILANGTRSTVVAGFVPVTTACQGPRVFTYRDKSYHRVSREAVKWWSTAQTTEVAAPCA